jgi:Fe-Mn family superoxide dismutase
LELHHGNHYRNYVTTLNEMLQTIERLEESSLEGIMLDSYRWNKPLYNHAAQVWNHHFYFKCMTANYRPLSRSLLERITKDFGSFDRFETDFRKAGNSAFGSGWAWLVYNSLTGKLVVTSTIGADNPMIQNEDHWPILTMDVWEHAYYSDYQNRRKDYTKAFINFLVDWTFVEESLSRAEVEAVIAAEIRKKARLEEEIARLERERQEAEVAAELARIERVKMAAEAEAARQEKKRLEIEAAAARLEDEKVEAEAEAARQERDILEVEVVAEDAKLEEEPEIMEAEVVADATQGGTGDEKEAHADLSDEIAVEEEASSEAENQEEAKESRNQLLSFTARVYGLLFGKAKATTKEEERMGTGVATDAAPKGMEDTEAAKPEEVVVENEVQSEDENREEAKESTNPFVRYPARVGRFFLGILWFILRVLQLVLKIIFI